MFGEILELIFSPLVWPFRKKRATRQQIKRFYQTAAWKRLRYDVLYHNPRCVICGRSAIEGSLLHWSKIAR